MPNPWELTYQKETAPPSPTPLPWELNYNKDKLAPSQYQPPGAAQTFLKTVEGQEPGVDYNTGAAFSTRYNMARTSNPKEEETYLMHAYGFGNFRKDPGGNWLVRNGKDAPWTPVFPTSVLGRLGTLGAYGAAFAPETAGGIGGSVVGGALAGPPGMLVGGGVGGALGYLADEYAKSRQGFQQKTTGETAAGAAGAGALNAAFGVAPVLKQGGRGIYGATSAALRGSSGATPETIATARSLEPYGVHPPVQSVAPNWRPLEHFRQIRNQVFSDPNAAARMQAVDTRMREVLQGFGYTGPHLEHIVNQIYNTSVELPTSATGRELADVLRAQENQLIAQAEGYATTANRLLDAQFQRYRTGIGRRVDPGLAEDFERQLTADRQEFYGAMGRGYRALTDATGNQPVVDLTPMQADLQQLLSVMPPQSVPPRVRSLFATSMGQGQQPVLVTLEEAHNIRTGLRQAGNVRDLAPIGQTRGSIMRAAGLVDRALHEAPVPPPVAAQLDALDAQFREGVGRYTNASINNVVRQVRAGRPPNPDVLARTILDTNSVDAARQMYEPLPIAMQTRIQNASLNDLFESATTTYNGRRTLDPDALLKGLDERRDVYEMMFGRNSMFIRFVRNMAHETKAARGDWDITQMPAGVGRTSQEIRRNLELASAARRAIAADAERDPRGALRSDNPQLIQGAFKFLTENETRTEAMFNAIGRDPMRPEWQALRREAITHVLKGAIDEAPRGLGVTVAGPRLEAQLGALTARQQELLLGNLLPDVQLLARQARALFPEIGGDVGVSQTAANIQNQAIRSKQGLKRAMWSYVVGRIADNPYLIRAIAGSARASPAVSRGMLSYLMQSGANVTEPYLWRGTKGQNATDITNFTRGAPLNPLKPVDTSDPNFKPRYGGPQE